MPARAQPRLETHGDQSPAVEAGRDATVNYGAISHGYTPAQLGGLIAAPPRRAWTALRRQPPARTADLRLPVGD